MMHTSDSTLDRDLVRAGVRADSFEARKRIVEMLGELGWIFTKTPPWIEWKGGDCPVSDHALVIVKLYSGQKWSGPAGELEWDREESSGDLNHIAAYRLLQPLLVDVTS